MIRLVILLVVLAAGFGGGVYFANKFPAAASKISAEEEKRILQAKLEATRRFKEKLDQLSASGAKPAGARASVVPRMISKNMKVRTTSTIRQTWSE